MMHPLMHLTQQSIMITAGNKQTPALMTMFAVEVSVAMVVAIAMMDGTTLMDAGGMMASA
jgi:hypothetical protein